MYSKSTVNATIAEKYSMSKISQDVGYIKKHTNPREKSVCVCFYAYIISSPDDIVSLHVKTVHFDYVHYQSLLSLSLHTLVSFLYL